MISFEKFNEEINYYTDISKKTGKNCWDQDSAQRSFTGVIENCELTMEQVEALSATMVRNNASIDMAPSNNKSVDDFKQLIHAIEVDIGKTM